MENVVENFGQPAHFATQPWPLQEVLVRRLWLWLHCVDTDLQEWLVGWSVVYRLVLVVDSCARKASTPPPRPTAPPGHS